MDELESDEYLRGRVGRRLFLKNIYLPDFCNATGGALDSLAALVGIERKCGEKLTVHNEQINLIEEGDLNMATSNTGRKLVTVTLMDQNPNVPDELAVVAQFTNVIDKGNQQATLMQLMIDNDIKGVLAQYNEARTELVDRQILERTGSEVKLLPVTIQDLEIQIS